MGWPSYWRLLFAGLCSLSLRGESTRACNCVQSPSVKWIFASPTRDVSWICPFQAVVKLGETVLMLQAPDDMLAATSTVPSCECLRANLLTSVRSESASELAQSPDPQQSSPAPKVQKPKETSPDPFEDLPPVPSSAPAQKEGEHSRIHSFFSENFGFRKEIMSQFDTTREPNGASRQSLGFEVLKKFSTATSTVASFDFQGRLVRRDGWNPVLNDMEGWDRQGWTFEYHNLYVDLYNVLNPVLNDQQRSRNVGRFNFRFGRFYVPFGLNLQTDTHGTVLQLSNERNFGFERDWYAGFWGRLNRHLNYDAYYLVGSGYDLKFKGQGGLGAVRVSLSNRYSSDYGLEGGLSVIGGQRLSSGVMGQDFGVNNSTMPLSHIETERVGLDARYKRPVPTGTLTLTTEFSGGRDVPNRVLMQLYQADYLRASRRWGLATQYRRFSENPLGADESIFGEFTWYFRNDVSSSSFHWIKFNIERQIERVHERPGIIATLQYYFYW